MIFDITGDVISNEKWNQIITELFIRGRKLNISTVFIAQSYFAVPKKVRLNCEHFCYYENSKQTRASTNCI